MNIRGADVHPGRPCPHSTGKGCNDYDNRPADPCDNFNCGWIINNSPLPDWMKPNEGKVIVLFNKLQWQGFSVDLAVPVGKRVPLRALDWLKRFSQQHRRPLIYAEQIEKNGVFQKEQQLFGHGPPQFQQEVERLLEVNTRLW